MGEHGEEGPPSCPVCHATANLPAHTPAPFSHHISRTWLIGMKISLTKKPISPVARKPMAVSRATFKNSFWSGFSQRLSSLRESWFGSLSTRIEYSNHTQQYGPDATHLMLFLPKSRSWAAVASILASTAALVEADEGGARFETESRVKGAGSGC